jgi:hypothetical protein
MWPDGVPSSEAFEDSGSLAANVGGDPVGELDRTNLWIPSDFDLR